MKLVSIVLCLLFSVTACQQRADRGAQSSQPDTIRNIVADSVTTIRQSYQYVKNGDTISLAITIQGDQVNGDLNYLWKEKDKNAGHIAGTLKDSLLLADYTFSSEGQQSVRQVAFKLVGDRAVEGFGEMEERGGKTSFVDPGKLSYDQRVVLQKVNP